MAALTYHDGITPENLVNSLEFKEGSSDKRLEMIENQIFKYEAKDLDQQTQILKTSADIELDAIDDDKKRKKIMKRLKKELQDILDKKYELKRKILSTQREREFKRVREVVMKGDEKTQMRTASQELERVQREIQEMQSRDVPS